MEKEIMEIIKDHVAEEDFDTATKIQYVVELVDEFLGAEISYDYAKTLYNRVVK